MSCPDSQSLSTEDVVDKFNDFNIPGQAVQESAGSAVLEAVLTHDTPVGSTLVANSKQPVSASCIESTPQVVVPTLYLWHPLAYTQRLLPELKEDLRKYFAQEKIIRTKKPLPQRVHSRGDWRDVGPECWGITLEQCQQLMNLVRNDRNHEWNPDYNVEDLVAHYVKPWTAEMGVGYSLLVNAEEPKEVNVMVSHAWKENAEEFFASLERTVSRTDVMYICFLANYQHNDGYGPTIGQQLGSKAKDSPFRKVLDNIHERGMQSGFRWRWQASFKIGLLLMFLSAYFIFSLPMILLGCVTNLDALDTCSQLSNEWQLGQIIIPEWHVEPLPSPYQACVPLAAVIFLMALVGSLVLLCARIYDGRMVAVPCRETDLYGRLWCTYEIFCAADVLGIPLQLARNFIGAGNSMVTFSVHIANLDSEKLKANPKAVATLTDATRKIVASGVSEELSSHHRHGRFPLWQVDFRPLIESFGTEIRIGCVPPGGLSTRILHSSLCKALKGSSKVCLHEELLQVAMQSECASETSEGELTIKRIVAPEVNNALPDGLDSNTLSLLMKVGGIKLFMQSLQVKSLAEQTAWEHQLSEAMSYAVSEALDSDVVPRHKVAASFSIWSDVVKLVIGLHDHATAEKAKLSLSDSPSFTKTVIVRMNVVFQSAITKLGIESIKTDDVTILFAGIEVDGSPTWMAECGSPEDKARIRSEIEEHGARNECNGFAAVDKAIFMCTRAHWRTFVLLAVAVKTFITTMMCSLAGMLLVAAKNLADVEPSIRKFGVSGMALGSNLATPITIYALCRLLDSSRGIFRWSELRSMVCTMCIFIAPALILAVVIDALCTAAEQRNSHFHLFSAMFLGSWIGEFAFFAVFGPPVCLILAHVVLPCLQHIPVVWRLRVIVLPPSIFTAVTILGGQHQSPGYPSFIFSVLNTQIAWSGTIILYIVLLFGISVKLPFPCQGPKHHEQAAPYP